ncbi:iron-hydroxamate ABC transporter substrate-binding protein [Bacillus sp. JJ722]|uniref:iron-hydroxamate ABC transporter substrate-binding protein n=1 Tax=Bacillus sp. JJ722 TaxID=3122973 RepID=UPI002FFE7026
MKKKVFMLGLAAVFSLGLAGCNDSEKASPESKEVSQDKAGKESADVSKEKSTSETQTITYLNEQYTLPSEVNKIVTASLEAMEDAAILGVKPIGAITIGGKLPAYVADELEGAQSVGEKTQPNYETLLQMKPDVILGTSKFQADVAEQLNKVATMVPVSHVSTNWEDNLRLMAQLTGKESEADQIINDYKADVTKVKEELSETIKDKKIVVLRIRAGNMFVYPEGVYLNPVIYEDLGATVPEEIKAAKAQEQMSLEKLAQMNPDYIFLQFDESENAEKPKTLEELQNNAIWKSIEAAKNNHVFVNAVDPLAQGGTAWSKTAFIKAVEESLTK